MSQPPRIEPYESLYSRHKVDFRLWQLLYFFTFPLVVVQLVTYNQTTSLSFLHWHSENLIDNMPKAEVGSTKYLNNKLKSKGLQRLRWSEFSSNFTVCLR